MISGSPRFRLASWLKSPARGQLSHFAFLAAFVSSAALLFSIAVSQTFLVLAVLLLVASGTRPKLPAAALPLAGFAGWTILSVLASDDPASGWPQLKKFLVFTILAVIFSLFRGAERGRRLLEAMFVCALLAAALSIGQFLFKWSAAAAAGRDFYNDYIHQRITGFYSHWMTFSEILMILFLMLLAYVLFSPRARNSGRHVWRAMAAVFAAALLLSFTRSVWLAILAGGLYLIFQWNRAYLWAVPVTLALAVLVSPDAVQRRVGSLADFQMNQNRIIMWRTGLAMIQTHPWLGVGPERVGPRFAEFQPEDVHELPSGYYGHLHNVFIHYAAERGLPAALFLIWFLAQVLWDHWRAARVLAGRNDERLFVAHGVIAATLGVCVVSCFDLTLGDSEILGVYLTIVALGYHAVSAAGETGAVSEL